MTPFPISENTPITYAGAQPKETDVIVIGGGVIGVCTAFFLAQDDKRVVLLEKGRIAGEQSSRNWGWIRQQGRDPDEIPIMAEAKQIWQDFASKTNLDIGLRIAGVTYLAQNDAEITSFQEWMRHAKNHNLDSKMLSSSAVSDLIPDMNAKYVGGIHTASDMRAEPWLAVPALAEIATRAGATLIENCAVRALDISAGRVSGVITEVGLIKSPEVILAGGAWSSLFLQNMGIHLPQLSVRATVSATVPLPIVQMGSVADKNIAFRRRIDGGYSIASGSLNKLFVGPDAFRAFPKFLTQLKADPFGVSLSPAAPKGFPDAWTTPRAWASDESSPFEKMRILNPKPDFNKIKKICNRFESLFPHLGPIKLKSSWAGMIDTMPDVVPIMDRAAEVPGLTVGTGFSGHGFGIGPAAGRILASLSTGREPGHDLTRFRLNRFSDGSKINLGPAI